MPPALSPQFNGPSKDFFFCGELSKALKESRLIPVLGEDIFRFKKDSPPYPSAWSPAPVELSGKTLDEVLGEIFDQPVTPTLSTPTVPTWIDKDFASAAINSSVPASARPFESYCRGIASARGIAVFVQKINAVLDDLYQYLDLSLLQRAFGWEMPLILSMTIDGVVERYREKYRSEYESISLIDGHDNGSGETVTDAVLHCFGSCYPERGSEDQVAISASSIAKAISQFCLINSDGPIKRGNRPALGNFLRGSNRKQPVYLFLGTNFSAYPAYFLKSFLENSKSDYRIFVASRHTLSDPNVLSLLDQFAPGKIRLLSLPAVSPIASSDYLDGLFDWLESQVKPRQPQQIPVVFLSYARVTETGDTAKESINKTRALKKALDSGGEVIAILDEQKFDTGEELPTLVRHNIYQADLLVIVGTRNYLTRMRSYGQSMNWLQRELALAKRKPSYDETGGVFPLWSEDNDFEGFRKFFAEEMKLNNPLIEHQILPSADQVSDPEISTLRQTPAVQNIIRIATLRHTARFNS